MYHVYTEKNHSEFSRTLITETKDYDIAIEKAEKAIEGKPELSYIIEQTDGSMNSYGDLIATVVARSDEWAEGDGFAVLACNSKTSRQRLDPLNANE